MPIRAWFGIDAFQHVGFVSDFTNGPWTFFGTGSGYGFFWARTLGSDGVKRDDHWATGDFDPAVPHTYRIAWTDTGVRYTIDGAWTVLHPGVPQNMEIAASDFGLGGSAITLDWLALGPYTTSGAFESRVFDAGDPRAVWWSLEQTGSASGIAIDTRSSIDGTAFSDWAPLGAGGAIASPPGRYIQYRARLSTSDPQQTPSLDKVKIGYAIDTVAPTVAVGDVTVSGPTATTSFTSPDSDVVRIECSLDAGAFGPCASPTQFTGIAAGAHTIHARAVDKAGNTGPEVEQPFTVTAPTAAIGTVDVSGSTATVSFSSPSAGVARLECSLDGAAFATCTSPQGLSGLAPGSHRIAVRAVDAAGNVSSEVEKTFTIPGPPADQPPSGVDSPPPGGGGDPQPQPPAGGGGPAPDKTAPRIALGSRTLRVSKSGKASLKLSCPGGETRCKVSVQLVATDAAGNRSTATTRLTLKA